MTYNIDNSRIKLYYFNNISSKKLTICIFLRFFYTFLSFYYNRQNLCYTILLYFQQITHLLSKTAASYNVQTVKLGKKIGCSVPIFSLMLFLHERMAHNIKFILAWKILFFHRFQCGIVAFCFFFTDCHNRTVMINPLMTVQYMRTQFFYHHCSRIFPIFNIRHGARCPAADTALPRQRHLHA